MSIRSTLHRFVRPFPQWSPIGFRFPQDRFAVRIGFSGRELDVTNNNNCAALVPLTLVIGLPPAIPSDELRSATLAIDDTLTQRRLGALQLKGIPSPISPVPGLTFFEVEEGFHSCLGWPRLMLDRWSRRRALARSTDAHSFVMDPTAVEQIMIFYICPRQVVLVSVTHEDNSNIFPMDILGPIADGRFSLGLRNTSPSVDTIKRSRRVALSSIRATDRPIAYKLGAHHKNASINLGELPFTVGSSERFGLPVPASPLRIRELEIDDFNVIGSHTFFLGRVVSDTVFSDEPQLHHTAGFHSYFQARKGKPFIPA